MRKRYPTAALIFAAAIAGKLTGNLGDWPAVALMVFATITVVGMDLYDGLSAGPIDIDPDGEGGGGGSR